MHRLLRCVALIALLFAAPAAASHLVTGNGFGFTVVAPETGQATSFYPHPYSFIRPEPGKPLSEGVATANFVKAIGWGRGGQPASAEYLDDSQVISGRRGASSGEVFMPFGLDRAALVIVQDSAGGGAWRAQWRHPLRSQRAVSAAGVSALLLRFAGIDQPLLLIPLAAVRTASAGQPLAASSAWALVALDRAADTEVAIRDVVRWQAGLAAPELAAREVAQFEQWRVKPTVRFASDAERHLWRQSETMLRIAQSREPNRPDRHGNGLIVAALPDTYFTPWVRDMAWSTMALLRMGHQAEARAALLAYFNARPTGKMRSQVNGADYQVSVVRYFGDGAEEPFFTMEGSTNIEFDDWGEVLWVLGEYLSKYDDPALLQTETPRGRLYETARDFIVRPLMANTERYGAGRIVAGDTSIWEERQKDAKHFAFSTAMAIVGLGEFANVAARFGDDPAAAQALHDVDLLKTGFTAAFARNGELRGTLEPGIKNDIDGALIPIINFGVISDPKLITNTVDRMSLLKVASGGYKRVRSTYTDPKIFEFWYEKEEFLFVDLQLAQLYRRLGRTAEADAMLARIEAKAAADHDIIPEMYVAVPCKLFPGRIGDPTGALPMVGYGAGAFVLHLLDRESLGART
ncbi:glycoside hydrolase family 15 protein [Sphingomonas sp.]|uniref:glycoside hydrolase family 15 protein n=1 Tax=Sphingomonas sp. TaxID=28214 RepID=UPI0025FE776B|nr:glycoside hydrolase family 15 protein [Sphingomonas sp.]MBV9528705.1 hypothetical protein [Sphingomonas sp.]